jgi:hypothetical protein
MAASTQPICQSLFDFLDGPKGLEQLEAIRNGTLGRDINRYVQSQLEQFHIGSIRDVFPESLWGSPSWAGGGESNAQSNPLRFGGSDRTGNGAPPIDLVGQNGTHVTGPQDLQPGLGGFDQLLERAVQPTEQIFRSHRD